MADWVWDIVVANPFGIMLGVIVAGIALFTAITIRQQIRADYEAALKRCEQLRRDIDRLKDDIQ